MSVESNPGDFNQDSDLPEDRRYYRRGEIAQILRDKYGYPVSKNLLEKMTANGIGPPEAGRWSKFVLYSLPEALRWAESRLRRSGPSAA
jgi:hypothetical protein